MGFIRCTNIRTISFTLSWWFTTFANYQSIRTTLSNVGSFFFRILIYQSILSFSWKRVLKKYCVTYPFVVCGLAFSVWIYFLYYRIQKKTEDNYPLDKSYFLIQAKFMRLMPSAFYSLLIIPMNFIYRKLAIAMTNFGRKKNKRKNFVEEILLFFCRKSSFAKCLRE